MTYHSGRVTSESTTVPGGGLDTLPLMWAKNLLLMRFFTTTTLSLGLRRAEQEAPAYFCNLQNNLSFVQVLLVCELPHSATNMKEVQRRPIFNPETISVDKSKGHGGV